MMIAVDNKLPQPPNDKWTAIIDQSPPYGQQVAFTDSTKTYAWIGYIADEYAPLPSLPASGQVPAAQAPAFWSLISDQS